MLLGRHCFPVQGYHLVSPGFPSRSSSLCRATSQSYNPTPAVTGMVWALSLSLATTQEIIVIFFSSAYLDVSVRRVCSYRAMPSAWRVPPFGNPRIKSYLLIPRAYRSLSRPSSPLRAKASPVYPLLLSSAMPPFAPACVLLRARASKRTRPHCCVLFLF